MQAALFDVTPFDPANLATVAGLLITVTIVASVVPALRASRVDVIRRFGPSRPRSRAEAAPIRCERRSLGRKGVAAAAAGGEQRSALT